MSLEATTNLWSSLLKESSKRSKLPDASCIFVGDKSVGKNAIITKVCAQTENADAIGRIKDLISYNYIDLDDGSSDAESMARINVWSFSSRTFDDCFEHVVRQKKGDRVVFVIGVDASKPDTCLVSVKTWLRKIKKYSQTYLHDREDSTSSSSSSTVTATSKVGFPVIIAACKADTIKADDTATLKRAKETQGQLRSLSLSIGASLIYTSAAGDINTLQLKKYITHVLFPENVLMDLAIEDGSNSAFIPAGLDSPELINIATSIDSQAIEAAVENLRFLDNFEDDATAADTQGGGGGDAAQHAARGQGSSTIQVAPIEIEDEEEWLAGLQSYISQAAGGSAIATATASSSSSSSAASGDNAAAVAAKSASATSERPPVPPVDETAKGGMHTRRRSAPVPAADDNKQEVDNFFKNLLAAPPKK